MVPAELSMLNFLVQLWYKAIMEDKFMSESSLDLFCELPSEQMAEEYAMELEAKAAELEVTVDYYMAEFM
jgi:hypothetical protein